MSSRLILFCFLALVWSGIIQGGIPSLLANSQKPNVSKIHGRIQIVDSFPDYRVKIVDRFPDLRVKIVDRFPDGSGKWQMVDSFPDFKIQIVESFPDFTIQYVEAFPGPDR